jgi:uncharacterized LabA/DUF88 family protein
MTERLTASLYVDGYNLYYGALRKTPYKWLNLRKLSQLLLPEYNIGKINYFTARVKARPEDMGAPVRQQAYLSALESIAPVEIHFGQFFQSVVRMALANPLAVPKTVEVIKTEEKGSDVNLASHLLLDAFNDTSDIYVVVSNDSDLMEPLRIAREDLGRKTGLVNPHKQQSRSLLKCKPTIVRRIRAGALSASQFNDRILLPSGRVVMKPTDWA